MEVVVMSGDCRLRNDWHVVADQSNLLGLDDFDARLLGVDITIRRQVRGGFEVVRNDTGGLVHSAQRYGYIWACLGTPEREILFIPEAIEPDRHLVTAGSIAVRVSGLRAVENFLDMAHFPFLHTGFLGEEPHTEVTPYKVELTAEDELVATECKFYQPVSFPTAKGGFIVEYTYKVFRPYTVALYKTNSVVTNRRDVIVLFVQPVDEENCVAHPFLCYVKEGVDVGTVRAFTQLIFGQDKPILENQVPKRLPLDPRAETPIRADAVSVSYRRWLRDRSITYGAIPANA
ncbi:aromatic ring-hydroxylating dioxygenase subunit alpha [Mesorhizobium australicum]